MTRRVAGVALVAALVVCAGFATVARANEYPLTDLGLQRLGQHPPDPAAYDRAWVGPQFLLGAGESVDSYVCPGEPVVGGPPMPNTQLSNLVVVQDDPDPKPTNFTFWSTGTGAEIQNGSRFFVHVFNWSDTQSSTPGGPGLQDRLRVVVTCTNNPDQFPLYGLRSNTPRGDYLDWWNDILYNRRNKKPGTAERYELVKRAFCWSPTYPGCSNAVIVPEARRFALHDGTDSISTTFLDPSLTRPPAIRLTGDAGCTARSEHVTVDNGSGQLGLVLRCHGLKRGARARLRFGKPLRVNFRLRRGSGSVRVQLAKPSGTVTPLVFLSYGPKDTPCNRRDRLRMRSRTFILRVNARCGRAAGNAVAHLYVGGLLQ